MSIAADLLRPTWFLMAEMPSFTRLGFDCRRLGWTRDEWNFCGQRWLVTGASTGIGREIARVAAAAGADVMAVARSSSRLQSLAHDPSTGGRVRPVVLDLATIAANRQFATDVAAEGGVDVLVNNVGVLLDAPATTAEGLDLAFATNLLGPFVLTETLFERDGIRRGGCVVNVSSGGMYAVPLEVARLADQAAYDGVTAYARHKRAQVVLTAQWRTRDRREVYVMHPGWVATPGVDRSLPNFSRWLGPVLRDVAAGADTVLWLAATRPPQTRDEGIWFDRTLRLAHVWPGSRGGDEAAILLDFLRRTAGDR